MKDKKSTTSKSPAKSKADKANKVRLYSQLSPTASSKEQKQFRSKARRTLRKHADAIIAASLAKGQKGMKEAVKGFNSYYTKQYVLNDLSLASCYTGSNEVIAKDLNRALGIVKKQNA